jgi:hypothetical protein
VVGMQDDLKRYLPVQADGTAGEPESRVGFMIRGLLSSRLEVGLPTDEEREEQDVNIYLTHLLSAYIDPEHYLRIAAYLEAYDSSLFERVQQSTSPRLKYRVYKANADHLLMQIGVFQNPTGRRPDALLPVLLPDDELHVGRAKTYYDFASTYGGSVFGRTSAIADVLGKLSVGFEKYVRILSHMRSEYLNLVERLSEGELYHLERSSQRTGIDALRNEFLDAYSEYRRESTPELRARVVELVARLERLDPDFHFEETL